MGGNEEEHDDSIQWTKEEDEGGLERSSTVKGEGGDAPLREEDSMTALAMASDIEGCAAGCSLDVPWHWDLGIQVGGGGGRL